MSIDYFYIGLRRLSATLDEMEEKANDSQSEDEDKMESYGEESLRSEKIPTEDSKSNEADEDSIQLGEEGKEFTRFINLNQLTAAKKKSTCHFKLFLFCQGFSTKVHIR